MKKLFFTIITLVLSSVVIAQPPLKREDRPLPNQFRDFVEFQKNIERPQIERKDGNVIITMSEEKFKQMVWQRKMLTYHAMNRDFVYKQRPQCICRFCENETHNFHRRPGFKQQPPPVELNKK